MPKPKTKAGYKEYTCDKLSVCVPEEYTEKRSDPNYYYYNEDQDFVYIHLDDLGTTNLTPEFFDSYVTGIKTRANNFIMIKNEKVSFAGKNGYHTEYTCNIMDTDCYVNSYLAQHGDQMYTVSFTTRGLKQSSEFDRIEDDVIEMLYFED